MIARSNRRVPALDFVIHEPHSDHNLSLVDSAGWQTKKDLARRRLIDRFDLLVEVSRINYPNFIRPGRASRRAANSGLVKEVVPFVENYLLASDVPVAQSYLYLKCG